jgi:hypothetical protein
MSAERAICVWTTVLDRWAVAARRHLIIISALTARTATSCAWLSTTSLDSCSKALLPLLMLGKSARVVHVSSLGQHSIDFDDVMLTRGYSGSRAYAQSKLAQIISTFDLAGELSDG